MMSADEVQQRMWRPMLRVQRHACERLLAGETLLHWRGAATSQAQSVQLLALSNTREPPASKHDSISTT
jgi:hypothetical protein